MGDAVDVAIGPDRIYVVRAGAFEALDPRTGKVVASVRVPELADFANGPNYRAVVDAPARRVWVVREGGVVPADAIEFDAARLTRLATVQLPGTVQDAAVLRGRVYLATEGGVRELRPGSRQARLVPGTGGFVGWVAADPSRDRLLVANEGFPTRLLAVRPDGTHRASASLPFGGAEVAVTRGVIWAGGFGSSEAWIVRLDPTTLAPTDAAGPLASMLAPGALFAATGTSVVWVRGEGTSDLWCMDATTGRVSQHFTDVPGPVASLGGPANARTAAYVVPDGVVRSLVLRGCPG